MLRQQYNMCRKDYIHMQWRVYRPNGMQTKVIRRQPTSVCVCVDSYTALCDYC